MNSVMQAQTAADSKTKLFIRGIKERETNMDAKQALEILSGKTKQYNELLEAIAVAAKSLNKQIPQKPLAIEDHIKYKTGKCPNCRYRVVYTTHCPDCGQKLDWNETASENGKEI